MLYYYCLALKAFADLTTQRINDKRLRIRFVYDDDEMEWEKKGKYRICIPFLLKESKENDIRNVCKKYHSITSINFNYRVYLYIIAL